MSSLMKVTPIHCRALKNIHFTECVLFYLDKDSKLKRAIPDFEEKFLDSKDSLVGEVLEAEKIAVFRTLRSDEEVSSPVFQVITSDSGEVISYNSDNKELKLEKLLLDSNKRQKVARMLKKTR